MNYKKSKNNNQNTNKKTNIKTNTNWFFTYQKKFTPTTEEIKPFIDGLKEKTKQIEERKKQLEMEIPF